ncbi:hypothetical protein D9615_002809 [Tricholomella constricta]|uniref:Uncharacterized protein n=1 Tax=Tricholomella constricta TaxID=117010 RepID=A0A8H5HFR4_9AGAR|nr:hypothetical protein D9615_002809 [Tricholomella constricta]
MDLLSRLGEDLGRTICKGTADGRIVDSDSMSGVFKSSVKVFTKDESSNPGTVDPTAVITGKMSSIRTAIVTGASSGIGRQTAIALLVAGWNVVLTGRRLSALNETAEMSSRSANSLILAGDVTDEQFVKELFTRTVEHFGASPAAF